MNKGKFWAVVILMSGALIGLILLQAYWIKHDLKLKEQQFGQTVMLAMNDIVDKVEQKENMKIIVHSIRTSGDSTNIEEADFNAPEAAISDFINPPEPPEPPVPPQMGDFTAEVNAQIERLREVHRHNMQSGEIRMNDSSSIDIRVEKDVQSKEVYALNLAKEEARFDSLASVTEQRVQSKIKKLNTMMQKYTFQVSDRNANIFSRIDSLLLDSIIKSELTLREINQPFNFGISVPEKSKLIYAKMKADSSSLLTSNFLVPLFPNDFFNRNEHLILSFPDTMNYLIYSMWPMLLSSLLFTLMMIFGFGFTLNIILRQKKLAEMKNDFINNMTHEFKTPIATIAIANESIRDPRVHGDFEKLNYYNNIIRDENQRMLSQVEHVLQMAQIDKGELILKKSEVDIHDILNQACGSSVLTVEQRDGKIETEFNAVNTVLFADGNHLMNVFTNLIDNANKYSPESPRILIKTANEIDSILISVTDNGIGMSKETQRRVFETFYRATTGNIHDVKGFGLGLAYVKAIIDAHGGSVSVNSEINKGSTFTVSLPIYKA